MKKICLLGATGSIGRSTIDIISNNENDFKLTTVSAGKNISLLLDILKQFPSIEACYITDEDNAKKIQEAYTNVKVYYGENGIVELLKEHPVDLVVNALVGFVGLIPTWTSLNLHYDVALANKESLVVGGELINDFLDKNPNVHLYPIDSEHVAIAKCLKGKNPEDIKELILTASGGSFRDYPREKLNGVTVEMALKHPSWKMGAKITIDSATMMNKGFEIIEAHYLFRIPEERIKVLLHDESMIHSLIRLKDGSCQGDFGVADMRIPIGYALYEMNYHRVINQELDLEDIGSLHFRKLDVKRYPALDLARRALREGGTMPDVLNAANEVANLAFREGKIPFSIIEEIVEKVMNEHRIIDKPSIDDLLYVNKWATQKAQMIIEGETKCNLL